MRKGHLSDFCLIPIPMETLNRIGSLFIKYK